MDGLGKLWVSDTSDGNIPATNTASRHKVVLIKETDPESSKRSVFVCYLLQVVRQVNTCSRKPTHSRLDTGTILHRLCTFGHILRITIQKTPIRSYKRNGI